MNDLLGFLKSFNIEPKNIELYKKAFTHSSFNVYTHGEHNDYERLEFMGDAVIEFYVSTVLFELYPKMSEGDLTRIRAHMVKSKTLATYGRKFGFAKYVVSSMAVSKEQIEKSDSILEDVFEALVGAIYLDLGIDAAFRYMNNIFYEDVKNIDMSITIDPKTRLQELMQSEYHGNVHYELIDATGPAHDRTFTVNVMFNDVVLATGVGKSKKAAEEEAAKKALEKGVM